jgi:sulfur dioxygenase
MNIRQLYDLDTGTYSYLLWDADTMEAVMIDPVIEQGMRDIRLIRELGLDLKYSLETHIHADHVTGGGRLRDVFGCRLGVHEAAKLECADLRLSEGDRIRFGNSVLDLVYTPGHTDTDVCFIGPGVVFTGDTLLIRGSGRTDFQSGDAGTAYDSITGKLFTLPDDYLIYPGHDYHGFTTTTIGEEKVFNPRLGRKATREEYITIMDGLDLDPPARMDYAVPGNIACGLGTTGTRDELHGS